MVEKAIADYIKARHGIDVSIHRSSGNGVIEFVAQAFKAGIEWQRGQNQVKESIEEPK
jgi:hypothetical protein